MTTKLEIIILYSPNEMADLIDASEGIINELTSVPNVNVTIVTIINPVMLRDKLCEIFDESEAIVILVIGRNGYYLHRRCLDAFLEFLVPPVTGAVRVADGCDIPLFRVYVDYGITS
ncbi:PREDICTED: uncharacterized protein LOC105562803 isoform X2 [Vollenhovia emeryi]|uniref:uncharacterized protein LOC105562803 isoform X2 n=1 Tax=Vollenhovia emeryi TaxID=411798 RepID=UPI0005F45584|nr:PREDICTED: uncharacterized protein LOC105562803 isoform X2 [Vollenhovia emeryi]